MPLTGVYELFKIIILDIKFWILNVIMTVFYYITLIIFHVCFTLILLIWIIHLAWADILTLNAIHYIAFIIQTIKDIIEYIDNKKNKEISIYKRYIEIYVIDKRGGLRRICDLRYINCNNIRKYRFLLKSTMIYNRVTRRSISFNNKSAFKNHEGEMTRAFRYDSITYRCDSTIIYRMINGSPYQESLNFRFKSGLHKIGLGQSQYYDKHTYYRDAWGNDISWSIYNFKNHHHECNERLNSELIIFPNTFSKYGRFNNNEGREWANRFLSSYNMPPITEDVAWRQVVHILLNMARIKNYKDEFQIKEGLSLNEYIQNISSYNLNELTLKQIIYLNQSHYQLPPLRKDASWIEIDENLHKWEINIRYIKFMGENFYRRRDLSDYLVSNGKNPIPKNVSWDEFSIFVKDILKNPINIIRSALDTDYRYYIDKNLWKDYEEIHLYRIKYGYKDPLPLDELPETVTRKWVDDNYYPFVKPPITDNMPWYIAEKTYHEWSGHFFRKAQKELSKIKETFEYNDLKFKYDMKNYTEYNLSLIEVIDESILFDFEKKLYAISINNPDFLIYYPFTDPEVREQFSLISSYSALESSEIRSIFYVEFLYYIPESTNATISVFIQILLTAYKYNMIFWWYYWWYIKYDNIHVWYSKNNLYIKFFFYCIMLILYPISYTYILNLVLQ